MQGYTREVVDGAVAEFAKAGVDAEALVEVGRPDEVIVWVAAERAADAVVMGTHGRTGLARLVIGSVADRVVRHSHVPVVLVPLRGHPHREDDGER